MRRPLSCSLTGKLLFQGALTTPRAAWALGGSGPEGARPSGCTQVPRGVNPQEAHLQTVLSVWFSWSSGLHLFHCVNTEEGGHS